MQSGHSRLTSFKIQRMAEMADEETVAAFIMNFRFWPANRRSPSPDAIPYP